MQASREEAKKVLDKVISEKKIKNLRLVEQAAVDHQKLTSDPYWNIYLQEIQAVIEMTEEVLNGLKEQIFTQNYLSTAELEEIRHNILIHGAQANALKMCINLPKEIVVMGEEAKPYL